jgi:uncharacterized OB-fold protein
MEWGALASTGRLYSWTRIHAAPKAFRDLAPYVVGIVDLDDGIRLAAVILSAPEQELVCEAPVEMVVLQAADGPLFAARLQRCVNDENERSASPHVEV